MSTLSSRQNAEIEASYAYLAGGLGALVKAAAREIDALAPLASPGVKECMEDLSRRMRGDLETMRAARRDAALTLHAAAMS